MPLRRGLDTQRSGRSSGHFVEARRRAPQRIISWPAILSVIVVVGVLSGLFVLFPMDWMRAPSVTVSIEQEAFSPNQDGNQDTAVVLYTLSENASVSAHVLDDTRSRVRTLYSQDAQDAGQHSVVWDGRDDHGKIVMDGQHYVRITARGTARETSNTVPVLVDTVAPVIRLANMPGDMQVKEGDITIEGVTEPDATVWLNNGPQPVPIDSSGGFRIEHRLQEGDNKIELAVTDSAGNRSSITRQVMLIVRPPDIIVDNPPHDLWINQKMLSVQGRVPPGTQLTVNSKEATVDADGQYNVDVLLQEGENILAFEARDSVGNLAEAERRVFLKTRPPALSLSSVKEGMEISEPSLLVVGQTEVGASVRLNGRELAVDSRGGFQGLVNLVQGDNLIKAEVVDRAGNVSTLSRRVTYTEPTAPTVPPNVKVILPALVLGAGTILASWMLFGGWLSPIAISFAADRSVMRPDAQGNVEPVLLSLDLSRSAKVTVDVWNDQDELVSTLLYRRKRGGGEHILVWDGIDDVGSMVPIGVYEVEATASTLTTSVSSSVRLQVEPSTPLLGARQQTTDRTRGVSS
jgi:flagellar hook assembly protein FlgD